MNWDIGKRTWWILCACILLAAALLRFTHLSLTVLHGDEGVNWNFIQDWVDKRVYNYDPGNYHGPSLTFLAYPLVLLFGIRDASMRLVTAIAGFFTIVLLLLMHKRIGRPAALMAATLFALSPGAVYVSRYYIHEMLLVLFTLGILVPMLWEDRIGAMASRNLTAASAALMFATKETTIITLVVMFIAEFMSSVLVKWLGKRNPVPPEAVAAMATGSVVAPALLNALTPTVPRKAEVSPIRSLLINLSAVSTFVIVFCLFFSSFYHHNMGVVDALKAFNLWGNQGVHEHVHPWWQYLDWMAQLEFPIEFLGFIGIALIALKARTHYNMFLALWAMGMLSAYSLVPYKTPWLTLNIMLPFAICAGIGLAIAAEWLTPLRVGEVMCIAIVVLTLQCIDLNFLRYDDDALAYVYARANRHVRDAMGVIDGFSRQTGKLHKMRIAICTPEYWPLPYYLRDYVVCDYWSKPDISDTKPDLVIGEIDYGGGDKTNQQPALDKLLGDKYAFMGKYGLRPGVDLLIYVRRASLPDPTATPVPTP